MGYCLPPNQASYTVVSNFTNHLVIDIVLKRGDIIIFDIPIKEQTEYALQDPLTKQAITPGPELSVSCYMTGLLWPDTLLHYHSG